MWNEAIRNIILGEISNKNCDVFRNNYRVQSNQHCFDQVNISSFRHLVRELTEIMPHADHFTMQNPSSLFGVGKFIDQVSSHEKLSIYCIDKNIFIYVPDDVIHPYIDTLRNAGVNLIPDNYIKNRSRICILDNIENIPLNILQNDAIRAVLEEINGEIPIGRRTYYPQGNYTPHEIINTDHDTDINENNMKNQSLNTILYGPPGTGKTFSVIDYSYSITNDKILDHNSVGRDERKKDFDLKIEESQIAFVTFHQSFSYEEFIEGIRADTKDEKISYSVQSGIFKAMCQRAEKDVDKNYVLIIDEINRGNISKIFGELITLVEDSKRAGNNEGLSVILPYSKASFSIPNNLFIIGTMNTADRSLALMDTALRRRFNFIEMPPRPDLLNDILVDGINVEKMLTVMNKRITILYDREHTLGHAFFMPLKELPTIEKLAEIFENKIIPLLQEYFFDDWDKIRRVLGDDKKKMGTPFIAKDEAKNLFEFEDESDDDVAVFYTINKEALKNSASYKNIYE
jgi:5-methylcytosine-specific restriction endonuclease McrBC GTP-binding regulatory subunit McrB